MRVETESSSGSAAFQGSLWGVDASAWADQEEQQRPIYEEVAERLAVGPGATVLDVGCGSGVFLELARGRGASACGLDATDALVTIARERVPEADVVVGDLQFLPYDDDTFDVVTGFNSFQFAADPVAALREAARVVRSGGGVAIQVWGRPERCELGNLLQAVAPLLPGPLPSAPGGGQYSDPGVLERLVTSAELEQDVRGQIVSAFEYPDDETMLRTMLSAGMIVLAVRTSGLEPVREAVLSALAPFRAPDGSYRVVNEWLYLVSRS